MCDSAKYEWLSELFENATSEAGLSPAEIGQAWVVWSVYRRNWSAAWVRGQIEAAIYAIECSNRSSVGGTSGLSDSPLDPQETGPTSNGSSGDSIGHRQYGFGPSG